MKRERNGCGSNNTLVQKKWEGGVGLWTKAEGEGGGSSFEYIVVLGVGCLGVVPTAYFNCKKGSQSSTK